MNLKKRLILILAGSGFIMAVFFHFSINLTMIPDLEEQKMIVIEQLKDKLQASLHIERRRIESLCNNWTAWEDLKTYVHTPNRHFEDEFMSDSSFLSHVLNLVLILDPGDRILFSKNYREDVKFFALDKLEMENAFKKIKETVHKTGQRFSGMVNSRYGPLMVVAQPVQAGDTSRYGLLLLGRFMDKNRLNASSAPSLKDEGTAEEIRSISFKERELFGFYLSQLKDKDFMHREDKTRMTLLYLVKDILGRPSIILATETRNRLLWVAKQHTTMYILFSVLSMAVLGFLLYFLIGRYINRRIRYISVEMKRSHGLNEVSRRLENDRYNDEISGLIREINGMLEAIEAETASRKNMEQRLVINEKLVSVGRLSASLAHEINNPMLAISNCFQVLKRTCLEYAGQDEGRHHQAIEVSEREIGRIRHIIASLLDYQRMEREELQDVNLDQMLLQSLDILKWSKQLNEIKITTKKKRDFKIFGSPGKLKQVFVNFILNAAESGDGKKGGELLIEMLPSQEKGFCEIHFKDNGPGVPGDIKDHLFEPFVSSKHEKGVGMGLYVSYKIIENHHGEILYDDSYEEGAHFIIKLPLIPPERTRHGNTT
jgi:signal transduction histidine kinase